MSLPDKKADVSMLQTFKNGKLRRTHTFCIRKVGLCVYFAVSSIITCSLRRSAIIILYLNAGLGIGTSFLEWLECFSLPEFQHRSQSQSPLSTDHAPFTSARVHTHRATKREDGDNVTNGDQSAPFGAYRSGNGQ